ncbi:MAG TPA: SPOR domain-containing protein [Casimicrobiaceae bacterium]
MSRRQPQRGPRTLSRSRRSGRGGTLLGVFIGLVLGLSIAAAVAYFLGRSGLTTPLPSASAGKEPSRSARSDLNPAPAPEKPRFDFYKILPGAEEPKSGADRRPLDRSGERTVERPPDLAKSAATSAGKPGGRFWLQTGAFASAAAAEDMKARLALSGWEAAIQTVSMPDKTQRFSVRLGPYDNVDELNRIKTELGGRGFEVAVIKNP